MAAPDASVHENDHGLVGKDCKLTLMMMEWTARTEEEQRRRIGQGGARSEAGKKWAVRLIFELPE